jgi:hypothetical protein
MIEPGFQPTGEGMNSQIAHQELMARNPSRFIGFMFDDDTIGLLRQLRLLDRSSDKIIAGSSLLQFQNVELLWQIVRRAAQ